MPKRKYPDKPSPILVVLIALAIIALGACLAMAKDSGSSDILKKGAETKSNLDLAYEYMPSISIYGKESVPTTTWKVSGVSPSSFYKITPGLAYADTGQLYKGAYFKEGGKKLYARGQHPVGRRGASASS